MEALGGVRWWQADIAAMGAAYREAVELWRAIGDRAEIANALYNYAFTFAVSANPRQDPRLADPDGEGARVLDEALGLYRELGDLRGQANVLWAHGQQDATSSWPRTAARPASARPSSSSARSVT